MIENDMKLYLFLVPHFLLGPYLNFLKQLQPQIFNPHGKVEIARHGC